MVNFQACNDFFVWLFSSSTPCRISACTPATSWPSERTSTFISSPAPSRTTSLPYIPLDLCTTRCRWLIPDWIRTTLTSPSPPPSIACSTLTRSTRTITTTIDPLTPPLGTCPPPTICSLWCPAPRPITIITITTLSLWWARPFQTARSFLWTPMNLPSSWLATHRLISPNWQSILR